MSDRKIYFLIGVVVGAAGMFGVMSVARGDDLHNSGWYTSRSVPTIDPGCWMAMTDMQGEVTVDWACIDRFAAKYDPKNPDQMAGYALMFKAIRDGKVKVK